MRVLVATRLTQGTRPSDFAFASDDEIVAFPVLECRNEAIDASRCGCRRCFEGLSSHRSTTTALVVEHDMSVAELEQAVRASAATAGWTNVLPAAVLAEHVRITAAMIVDVARRYPPGTILERRGTRIAARSLQAALFARPRRAVFRN